jgi:hypothetical protein
MFVSITVTVLLSVTSVKLELGFRVLTATIMDKTPCSQSKFRSKTSPPSSGSNQQRESRWHPVELADRKFGIIQESGGARGSVVVKALATNRKVAGSIPDEVNF